MHQLCAGCRSQKLLPQHSHVLSADATTFTCAQCWRFSSWVVVIPHAKLLYLENPCLAYTFGIQALLSAWAVTVVAGTAMTGHCTLLTLL